MVKGTGTTCGLNNACSAKTEENTEVAEKDF